MEILANIIAGSRPSNTVSRSHRSQPPASQDAKALKLQPLLPTSIADPAASPVHSQVDAVAIIESQDDPDNKHWVAQAKAVLAVLEAQEQAPASKPAKAKPTSKPKHKPTPPKTPSLVPSNPLTAA